MIPPKPDFMFRCRHHVLDLGRRTQVMGILNVTPDSFSDGGHFFSVSAAVERAHQMAEEGADIIDIGGESSRPGASPISVQQEIDRVLPVIEALVPDLDRPLSIDTYKSEVAAAALAAGAAIVNDISGCQFDPEVPAVAARYQAGVVVMHILGTPQTMQKNIQYDDLFADIRTYLAESIRRAEAAGVGSDQILIDPGIGFGKTVSHNLALIQQLTQFQSLHKPVLVGASRKSFIGKVLGDPVTDRLEGSLAVAVLAAINGAHVLRVHDVAATVRALRLTDAVHQTKI